MIVSLIVAKAENNAIGKDNDLIWHLPDDMKFFSNTTKGHYVIMGRKNYDSIPLKYRPLPARPNVIVTNQEGYTAQNCDVVNSIEAGIELAKSNNETEAFIIGGGQIYRSSLNKGLIDKLYLTFVHESFDADVYFPEIDLTKWDKVSEVFHPTDAKHPHSFTICGYLKKK
jgi:dihydrofolate reductase